MGYQVLARKWRPSRFSELVGQEHVVSAISHALDNDRLHHAYLFTGTRGVGKTTIARIFSKSLNCLEGQSANPCGKCDVCVSVEQGRFVDLLEIDAASRTKVEDTRELLENVQYKPTSGRYKVYLIDEVHMLSKHSFNALLKTLEEPPPHVKFLLATTDPQKLPITILSRCLQFNLKALSREQIETQLAHILEQETIPFESGALKHLARAAQGSMRDALSLTDQAIAQGNNQVSQSVVTDMLGLMDKQVVLKILNAVVSNKQDVLFDELEKLEHHSPDYEAVLTELSGLLHQIALTHWVPEACKLETTHARAVFELSKKISPEHVQLLYKLALEGKKEFPYSIDGRTCLEMTLLRMMSFAPKSFKVESRQAAITENVPVAQPIGEPEIPSTPVVNDTVPEPTYSQDEYSGIVEETSVAHESAREHFVDEVEMANAALDEMNRQQAELEKQRATPTQNDQQSDFDKTQALLSLRQKLTTSEDGGREEQPVKKPQDPVRLSFSAEQKSKETEVPQEHSVGASNDEQSIEGTQRPPWDDEPSHIVPTASSEKSGHVKNAQADVSTTDVSIELETGQSLTPYLKNGDKLVHSSQVDNWSNLIERSRLAGLNKQIALNASFDKDGQRAKLIVHSSQNHLISDASVKEISEALSEVLQEHVQVELETGEPNITPQSIQNEINAMRQNYAYSVVQDDEVINEIVSAFDAKVDSSSIQPR